MGRMASFFPPWANKGAQDNCPGQFAVKTQGGRLTSEEVKSEANCDSLSSLVKFWTSLGYYATPPRPAAFLEIAEFCKGGRAGCPVSLCAPACPHITLSIAKGRAGGLV